MLLTAVLIPAKAPTARAAEPPPGGPHEEEQFTPEPIPAAPEELRRRVIAWIALLDSDQFYQREGALRQLREAAARPEASNVVSEEINRVLVGEGTSFEVRKQLSLLDRSLPKTAPLPAGEATPEEIDRLIGQLEADAYAARVGAASRLQWLLSNPRLVCPILQRVKDRMAQSRQSADSPQWLRVLYDRAREVWLLSDPGGWDLPTVSQAQVGRWGRDLARTLPPNATARQRQSVETAQRELRDLLARDEAVPGVKSVLEAELARQPGSEAATRLQDLIALTRPALAVEFWEGGKQEGVQHLLVGVPTKDPAALRASHFDRVDDRVAHCISGNNLVPGDYPVGVGIPHPSRQGSLFHLVNLPTPRRRMAYDYVARTDMAQRLADLTRRTLDRVLESKRPLARAEIIMAEQLDPTVLSAFAGRYLNLVDDGAQDHDAPPSYSPYRSGVYGPILALHRAAENASRHGMLASLLVRVGNARAVPGLLEAVKADRFLAPSNEAPCRLGWLAALAIAQRDPWPQTDPWLAGLLDREEALVINLAPPPELGATAAGLLLKRRSQDPGSFDLESVGAEVLTEAGMTGYRFKSPEARLKVRQWWSQADR